MRLHSTTLAVTAAICLPAAFAQTDPALLRCPQLAEPAARLACYDAAYPPPPLRGSSPDAVPGAPTAASLRSPAPLAPSSARTQDFGLEKPKADTEAVQTVEAAVAEGFYGWGPNEKIRLLNGQVWEVVDGSSASLRRAAGSVKIRRGALGSFYMDFDGLNKSPRVRRLQ